MPSTRMKSIALYAAALILALGVLLYAAYKHFAPGQDQGVTQAWNTSNESSDGSISHEEWQVVLDDYLIADDPSGITLFDYQGLIDDGGHGLDAYLESLASIDPRDYNRAEQFAYWVNLYNALTVKVVVESYPVESIKQIGESTIPPGPWNDPVVLIAGEELTLNHIEHSILRPIWQDFRIHFAVNCASIGCPNLQPQAFTADNTEALLEQATFDYLGHSRGLAIEEGQVWLSSIFSWYQEDFGNNESELIELISDYLPDGDAAKLGDHSGGIEYRYDWRLNDYQ